MLRCPKCGKESYLIFTASALVDGHDTCLKCGYTSEEYFGGTPDANRAREEQLLRQQVVTFNETTKSIPITAYPTCSGCIMDKEGKAYLPEDEVKELLLAIYDHHKIQVHTVSQGCDVCRKIHNTITKFFPGGFDIK